MDDLGNRSNVNVRDGNDVAYSVDNLTNRYNSVGDANLSHDAAGNLTTDKDGYQHQYDYENRLVKILDDSNNTVAEYAYDALGRRIKKVDSKAGETTVYYYNNNWQVMADYNDSDVFQQWYAYGNYIDETLWQSTLNNNVSALKCYVHDHLYSPVALVNIIGNIVYERYEYDAYGNATIHTAAGVDGIWLTDDDVISQSSAQNNPYLFTGRTVDTLDDNNLKIQYNRNRYYNQKTATWLTQDPLGYVDSMNLYEYACSSPAMYSDPWGMDIFDNLLLDDYDGGSTPPADGDFEHGGWNVSVPPWWYTAHLAIYKRLAGGNVVGGWMLAIPSAIFGVRGAWTQGWSDAADNLDHYLSNTGGIKNIPYIRMLRESKEARDDFVRSLKHAQYGAEKEHDPDNEPTPIVQLGHSRYAVTSSNRNWRYAVQTYHTWGSGRVERKCKKDHCCYRMTWTLNMRDNYEFEDVYYWGGLVFDSWMWELNYYGRAKHFKTRGQRGITVTWPKGYRFDIADARMLIEGRQPHFPECDLW